MAGQEVYAARLAAWVARALGATGSFAVNLDTEGLGFQMPEAIAEDPAVKAAGAALVTAATVLRDAGNMLEAAASGSGTAPLVQAFARLFDGLHQYVDAADEIFARISAKAASLPVPERNAAVAFGALLPRRMMDFFVIDLIDAQLPRTLFLLRLLGLIDRRAVEATGALNEPRFVRNNLRLDRIRTLTKDPMALFADVYGWGTPAFDPLPAFRTALAFFGRESAVHFGKNGADAFLKTGPFHWSRDGSENPPALKLDISKAFSKPYEGRIELTENWGMQVKTDLSISGGASFKVTPPFSFSAAALGGSIGGAVSFLLNRNEAARGMTLVGGNDLVGVTVEDIGVGAELAIGASTSGATAIDPGVRAELKQLTVTIGSKGSDSFLASLLGGAEIKGSFDLGLGWKPSEGLVVKAAGGLEIAIPMHQSIGPASFETLYLVLKANPDGSFSLETSAGITGKLGPLTAMVERMGVTTTLSFSNSADKTLGPLDLSLGFKPPNGVGLAIDAGVVRGGGYLYCDYDKGEYAGALELVFAEFLALKAVGIISTRMPDGSSGFSLLVVITAEFGTPIQLGFGFTLVGVGGLLGLNRTMLLEELAEGVRTGAVESVMFPTDVIANAPRIISDMRRFFPPQKDTFLIGPMAKLGWGTPTLVSASLGVIIEVPPGNVAILGVLKCILPDEDAALLVLQVKFIGALEVDKDRMWFFASLYGSRVLYFPIDGEMGLLISWGDQPEFILSVGGFHPSFSPPPMPFPSPRRISFSILNQPLARIRVAGYFAVTSNTAQFGASVDLFFGLDDFSVEGHIGFDALFQFSPFYFVITFSASMSVKVFGAGLFSVRIRGKLEGTSPWHVEAEGSISLLFFDIDVPISLTWGESANTVLAEILALPLLKIELEKRENWVALPPAGSRLSVSLRPVDAADGLILHPLGMLRVSQRALPLELSIEKLGNQRISDISKAELKISADGLEPKAQVREPFATAQFREIDAAAKLSAPGYERQVAGADISAKGADTRTSHAVKRIVLHELITIDSNYKEHLLKFFNVGKKWFVHLLGSNATARSPLSAATLAAKVPFADAVKASAPGFVIVDTISNSAWTGGAAFSSHAQAKDMLAAQVANDPSMVGKFHVVPAAEMLAA